MLNECSLQRYARVGRPTCGSGAALNDNNVNSAYQWRYAHLNRWHFFQFLSLGQEVQNKWQCPRVQHSSSGVGRISGLPQGVWGQGVQGQSPGRVWEKPPEEARYARTKSAGTKRIFQTVYNVG